MEYTVIEGKKNLCEGFRYVKAREPESCIYVKCSLFRTHSCECNGKINKSANLFEISTFHNHEAVAYNHDAITLSNKIKRPIMERKHITIL